MKTDPSHDFGPEYRCFDCTCHVLSLEAMHPCRPSTDPVMPEPAEREIDYTAITKGIVG